MNKLVCKVSDVFQLKDRLVLQLDMLYDDFAPHYSSGEALKLHRPDGSIIETKSWPEMFFPTNLGRPACLSVEDKLSRADIPLGTEIWLEDTEEKQRNSA